MNDTSPTSKDVTTMLTSLADDLVSLMISEHQNIHQELEHVRQLVGDATRSLTASFDEMNILAIEQNTTVSLALQLNNATNEELLERCKRAEQQYRDNQVNIVTALQFEDIVQQLMSHAQKRTLGIQDMFKRLNDALQELKKSRSKKDDPEFISRIKALKQDVAAFRTQLDEENPVRQSSLATGKTELF